jgi:hypothetical protein
MRKKITITESERQFILKMYGILNEQQQIEPKDNKINIVKNVTTKETKSVFSKSIKLTFDPGYHSETYIKGKEKLNSLIDEVKDIISTRTKYATAEIVITVATGESKIPNYDKENNVKIGEKGLAILRKKTIDKYLSEKIAPFLEGKGIIKINNVEPIISGPEWDKARYERGDQTLIAAYEQAQFIEVKIDILMKSKSYDCLNGMTIELSYKAPGDHECNNAVFELYLDNTRINRYDGKTYGNLNNDGIFDEKPNEPRGSRYNKFVVTDEMAKEIVSKTSNPFLAVKLKCINAADVEGEKGPLVNSQTWQDGCHYQVGDIKITSGLTNITTLLKGSTPRTRGQIGTIGYINACGGNYKPNNS